MPAPYLAQGLGCDGLKVRGAYTTLPLQFLALSQSTGMGSFWYQQVLQFFLKKFLSSIFMKQIMLLLH